MRFFVLLTLLSSLAFAQTSQQAVTNQSTTTIGDSDESEASKTGIILAFKSTTDSMQLHYLGQSQQKNFEGKQELLFGYSWSSGWAVEASMVQYAESFSADAQKSFYWSKGDPSMIVLHPALYQDKNLTIAGKFRRYFPYSAFSVAASTTEYAYYSTLNYIIDGHNEIENTAVPTFYNQPSYADSDVTTYFEDWGDWSYKINKSMDYGFGQYSQIENHKSTDTGYSVEAYGFFDFNFTSNIVISPRIYVPLYAKGSVYQGPTTANLDNARAELFFEASL